MVSSTSSSIGVFAGDFVKGPVGAYTLINTSQELEDYYGKPNDNNYNDWYQVYNYLTYASQIYVSRAGNSNGTEKEIANCLVKKIGETIEPIPGIKATSDIATAIEEGAQGNNIVVDVFLGDPLITQEAQYAKCSMAVAKAIGTEGNNIKINIAQDGILELEPEVKSTCYLGTAILNGADGNNISVKISNGTPLELQAAEKAECQYATAKETGEAGNDLKINIIKNDNADWDIRILRGNLELVKLHSISNDSEAELLDNDYVDFKEHVAWVEGLYPLTGGCEQIVIDTYVIQTYYKEREVDRQDNIYFMEVTDVDTNNRDVISGEGNVTGTTYQIYGVIDNDYINFNVDEYEDIQLGTFKFEGGKDAVTQQLYRVETYYKSGIIDTQTKIASIDELADNNYVTFIDDAEIVLGETSLEGGVNEESTPTYTITTVDTTKPYDVYTQEHIQAMTEVRDNALVNFNRQFTLQTGTWNLEGGEDGFAGGTDLTKIQVATIRDLSVGQIIKFENVDGYYKIVAIDSTNLVITLDRPLNDDIDYQPELNSQVYDVEILFNGSAEVVSKSQTEDVTYYDEDNTEQTAKVPKAVSAEDLFQYTQQEFIGNSVEFEEKMSSIGFTSPNSKLKFISRNPGAWCKNIQICIAKPESFEANDYSDNHVPRYAFDGLVVDDFFEYAPTGDQFGIMIYDMDKDDVVEIYTVSMDPNAKDSNNRSIFVETVINRESSYVFVKVNEACNEEIADTTMIFGYDAFGNSTYVGNPITLKNGTDSTIQADDLITALELFENTEEIDIDNVIANELDEGVSAKNLTETRKDCICFIGANYEDVVNKKSTDAVANLVQWRKTGAVNYNSMWCVALGNYMYQYDQYADKNRWINVAGACAGLRAQTAQNYDTWWASAGLERGQLSNVVKLAFNPTKAQRDTLYKNGINPICTFPGLGTVLWGQKTLLGEASSFDRVNVRALFNTLERTLTKMAKSSVMEFNDSYTRNSIVSTIKPYLEQVQSGRGIQGYLVICDESNNTAQVIANNQLVVDIYIQPTYVAEFIRLNFINSGTNAMVAESTV